MYPDAALLALQQPGVMQHLQVMADRRLGQVERLVEITDVRFVAGWEATRDIRRRRTGSASALSNGAIWTAWE
jgi:hypothetical protein